MVRPGYKQTEAGVVPDDWNAVPLGQLLQRPPSYGINAAAVPLDVRLPKYIRITDITDDGRYSRESEVSVGHPSADEYMLEQEDLVVARTGASVGKSYLYDPADGPLVYAGFLIRVSPDPELLLPSFVSQYLHSRPYWCWVLSNSMRSGQPGLNGRQIANLPIPVPSTRAEQEAIAGALSDADALIESLEKLIAKKRQIKQGAMQELLRPDSSSPTCLLRDVSSMKGRIGWQGLKQSEFTANESDPFLITGMNFRDGAIDWSDVYHVSRERYGMAPEIQLRSEDVLMTKDGTIGKVLFVEEIPSPGLATLNSHLLLFRPLRDSYKPRFLYYQLQSEHFQDFIELNKSGTTFFGLSQESVGRYPVPLPPFDKQVEVAAILSDMDSEIAVLEIKLAKARQIKQGMMQELLTGRIRLV